MDVKTVVSDLQHLVETVDNLVINDMNPTNLNLGSPEAKLLSWFFVHLIFKSFFKFVYGPKIWDETSLVHNIVSVLLGIYDIYNWDLEESSTCESVRSRRALVITLQLIHCLTDFFVYLPEMIKEPVYFWHHLVLLITSLILPYCPGCYYVAIAYTLAEAGSASIAIDAEWRKSGRYSRGLKRVIIFGLSRLINIYLLFRIYLVTPSTVYFTISTVDQNLFTVNFPICMITSVGGSLMMLMVNGVTWFRMYKVYVHQKKKRKESQIDAKKNN